MEIRVFDVEIKDKEWHELCANVISKVSSNSIGTKYYANGTVVYTGFGDVSDGIRLIQRYHSGERSYKLFKELKEY